MIVLIIIAAAFVVGMLMPEPKKEAPVKEDYDFRINVNVPRQSVFGEDGECTNVCAHELSACC
jgi:hypothetical protein